MPRPRSRGNVSAVYRRGRRAWSAPASPDSDPNPNRADGPDASGHDVVVRATAHGVHQLPMVGIPATDRPFAMAPMHRYRGRGDRLAEHWGVLDQLGMLAQAGALPLA